MCLNELLALSGLCGMQLALRARAPCVYAGGMTSKLVRAELRCKFSLPDLIVAQELAKGPVRGMKTDCQGDG